MSSSSSTNHKHKLERRKEMLSRIEKLESDIAISKERRTELEDEIQSHKAYLSMRIQSSQRKLNDPTLYSLSKEFNETYVPRRSTELTRSAAMQKSQSPAMRDLDEPATRVRTELTLEEEMIYNSTNVLRGDLK